jgi:hypothetical protein
VAERLDLDPKTVTKLLQEEHAAEQRTVEAPPASAAAIDSVRK